MSCRTLTSLLPTKGGRGIHFLVTVAFLESRDSAVNHIALDKEDEAVKRFVLSLPADANGSVLELDGCMWRPPTFSAVMWERQRRRSFSPWNSELLRGD